MKRPLIVIGVLILSLSFQSAASEVMPQCCGGIAADQNCDGRVGTDDLALAESHWGLTIWEDPEFDPRFDLDGNGEIDLADIEILLEHMGMVCGASPPAVAGQANAVHTDAPHLLLQSPDHPIPVSASSFTVEVIVSDAVDLADAEYRLTYDPAIVDVTEIPIATFLGQSGRTTGQFDPAKAVRMLAPGFIGFLGYSYGDQPGVNGQGMVATINVTPLTVGTTELSLGHSLMFDTGYNLVTPVITATVVTVADCIAGDLNCSGTVDVSDIMLVATRWGTSETNRDPDNNLDTPNYNGLYDPDGDKDIDIVDIQTVAALWGSTGP